MKRVIIHVLATPRAKTTLCGRQVVRKPEPGSGMVARANTVFERKLAYGGDSGRLCYRCDKSV